MMDIETGVLTSPNLQQSRYRQRSPIISFITQSKTVFVLSISINLIGIILLKSLGLTLY